MVVRRDPSDDPSSGGPRDMDRLLRSIRFSPRESLGPELWGALPRGGALPAEDPVSIRAALIYVTMALAIGIAAFVFWRNVVPSFRVSTVDRCCADLDGGGLADDGIAVTTRSGETVRTLTIYEDRDRSGGFSAGDTVRFTRGREPIVTPGVSPTDGVRRLCCSDYDGGGKSDDGLLIVGSAPDRIDLAAIYESDGHTTPVLR